MNRNQIKTYKRFNVNIAFISAQETLCSFSLKPHLTNAYYKGQHVPILYFDSQIPFYFTVS